MLIYIHSLYAFHFFSAVWQNGMWQRDTELKVAMAMVKKPLLLMAKAIY